MRPGARIQAAIELIEAIETSLLDGGAAADHIIQHYFRARRYAGSKDRRNVTELVYGVLRQRGELVWRLGETEDGGLPRLMVLLSLRLGGAEVPVFDAETPHDPAPINAEEQGVLDAAVSRDEATMPNWARANIPEWLTTMLVDQLGDSFNTEMAALAGRAPLDLRVNQLQGDVETAQLAFPDAQPGQWAPASLRLAEPRSIQQEPAFQSGLVEVQDEGSQIASLLVGAKPGETIFDLCAGAGGKSLAIAAGMDNQGNVVAWDKDRKRLSRLASRSKKSSAENINVIKSLEDKPKKIDRVVLDVPCSGSGTWRRNPELRWRLTPERLGELCQLQAELLDQGAGLVASGGQITYITCSILVEEGEAQVAAFLERNSAFKAIPYGENWPVSDREPPPSASSESAFLRLSPAQHQTDGFFVAVLQHV